jgi:hypothetical protein
MNDTAKLIAIVVLASFATERVLAATAYVLDTIKVSRLRPRRVKRLWLRQSRKLFLLAIAAGIAALVVWRADVRVLKLLKLDGAPVSVDYALSWLIVLGGADKLRALLGAATAAPPPPAVKISVDGEIAQLRKVS